jgi:hypothetical protein
MGQSLSLSEQESQHKRNEQSKSLFVAVPVIIIIMGAAAFECCYKYYNCYKWSPLPTTTTTTTPTAHCTSKSSAIPSDRLGEEQQQQPQ